MGRLFGIAKSASPLSACALLCQEQQASASVGTSGSLRWDKVLDFWTSTKEEPALGWHAHAGPCRDRAPAKGPRGHGTPALGWYRCCWKPRVWTGRRSSQRPL